MIDYLVWDKKLRKDVYDAKVVRAMFEGSDHYSVSAMVKIQDGQEYGRSNDNGAVNEVVASERMDKKEVGKEYGRRVYEGLNEARTIVRGHVLINGMFSIFKEEVVANRVQKGRKNGSA